MKYTRQELDSHYNSMLQNDNKSSQIIMNLVQACAKKVLTRTRNLDLIDDVAQEVIVKLFEKRNYNSKRSSLVTYVMLLVHSTYMDKLRFKHSQAKIMTKYSQHLSDRSCETSLIDDLSSVENRKIIRHTLEKLRSEGADFAILHIYLDRPLKALELCHKIPVGTYKSIGNRTRKFLATKLQELC